MDPKDMTEPKNKARVLITKECNRSCSGCCNNFDSIMRYAQYIDTLSDLPQELSEVMISGGEPMLFTERTLRLTEELKERYPFSKLYLYSSYYNNTLEDIIPLLDGFQYTIHEGATEEDLLLLDNLQELLDRHKEEWTDKSFRLYIDDKVDIPMRILPNVWNKAKVSTWLTEEELLNIQPNGLPEGEALYVYTI